MIKCENKEKMGKYIDSLISKKYKSRRQFCKDYLEKSGLPINDEEIRKMNNRFTQIVKGKKGLQLYDLPLITDLFGISCEEILSCGKTFVPISNHVTNYRIAFSKDEKLWSEYMECDDKIFLNSDEYGKTVLDYALEFKNYSLIHWLMENQYISFEEQLCYGTLLFLAKTSMKRRPFPLRDSDFPPEVTEMEDIRKKLVALAIENGDLKIMEKMKGREMPSLYQMMYPNVRLEDRYYNDNEMIESIACSRLDEVFDYFSEEFSITLRSKCEGIYIYPNLGKVIDRMLLGANQDKNIICMLLEKVANHNKKAVEAIKGKANLNYQSRVNTWSGEIPKEIKCQILKEVLLYYRFDESVSMASFMEMSEDGIRTNVIYVAETSKTENIKRLIDEANRWYDKLKNFENELLERTLGSF